MGKRIVALDIETYDPNIDLLGDGSCRHDGRILCCGAYGDGISCVMDFDNPNDVQKCKDLLADDSINKVFHNGVYDLSWLYCGYGFDVKGVCHDTMTRAGLIDEYQSLNLDDCCKRFGVQGKNKEETIEAWFEDWKVNARVVAKAIKKYGLTNDNEIYIKNVNETWKLSQAEVESIVSGNWKKDVWANVELVWNDKQGKELMKRYNLQDCKATYELFKAQEKFMGRLQRVYELECKLTILLMRMKKLGIRFDYNRMCSLADEVRAVRDRSELKLIEMYGVTGEMIASPKKLGERLNEMGIHSPVKSVKTGVESWATGAISRIHHPIVEMIEEYKNYNSILCKYLEGSLSNSIVDGRIHCTFYPTQRDDGGTVTGRFSCKHPNLQQIPARDKGHGMDFSQDMRSLFLPEEGKMIAALDYSQIEYLLLAHFAVGSQAEWFREQANSGVDFHKVAMAATGITYRPVVKTFNYGVIYGMGWRKAMDNNYNLFEKLAAEHGQDIETFTKNIYYDYHKKLPVIKETMEWCQNTAKLRGYVETMGGRILHKPKPQYDPTIGKINDFIYKMLNKLIQGTAADILKTALVQADEAGLYDVLDLHLLVHDEQVVSVPFNKTGVEAVQELQRIMGDVYKEQLLIPMKAECELGPNWGYWSGDIYEEMKRGNFDPAFFNKDYKETH